MSLLAGTHFHSYRSRKKLAPEVNENPNYWATIATVIPVLALTAATTFRKTTVRTDKRVPDGFMIWMLYGAEYRDDLYSQHRSGLTRHGSTWLGWFWIGNTVFLVASEGASYLLEVRLKGISPIVRQIYPQLAETVKWPPEAASFTGGISPEHMLAIGSL